MDGVWTSYIVYTPSKRWCLGYKGKNNKSNIKMVELSKIFIVIVALYLENSLSIMSSWKQFWKKTKLEYNWKQVYFRGHEATLLKDKKLG